MEIKKKSFDEFSVGDSELVTKTITNEDVMTFAEITTDFNPLHVNEEYAKKSMFKNRIAHGMISAGLIAEVEGLLQMGYSPKLKPMKAIGYRHVIGHLKGTWDLDEAKRLMQRDTRRYAKRQLTWLRHDPELIWVKLPEKAGELEALTKKFLNID